MELFGAATQGKHVGGEKISNSKKWGFLPLDDDL